MRGAPPVRQAVLGEWALAAAGMRTRAENAQTTVDFAAHNKGPESAPLADTTRVVHVAPVTDSRDRIAGPAA